MLENIIYIILFCLSVVLTFSVLAQPGKQGGFSTSITGVDSSTLDKNRRKRRGEAIMMKITIVSSIAFLSLCITAILLTK